jgi:cytidylate kinase
VARKPIVAIDGPAGSGKSTTARAVAQALGFAHVDSGALYRAVTLVGMQRLEPSKWTADGLVAAARAAPLAVHLEGARFEVRIGGAAAGDAIRSDVVTRQVSRVAAIAPVRDYVNGLLRAAARDGGIVMDGRDIGTVVFPDAEVKVFLVADPEERARRRLLEKGRTSDPATVRAEAGALMARDTHDSQRDVAPLAQANGAVLIDTTRLGFEEQVGLVVDLVRATRGGGSV